MNIYKRECIQTNLIVIYAPMMKKISKKNVSAV
jgi:hypothetical protein